MKVAGSLRAPGFMRLAAWIGILFLGGTASAGGAAPRAGSSPSASSSQVITSQTAPRTRDALRRGPDACALLSGAAVKKVQSERLKGTKGTRVKSNSLIVSECFYSLTTFSNSISVALAVPDPDWPAPSGTRDLWDSLFHRPPELDTGRDEQGKETSSEGREEHRSPVEIHGLGDEAYWISSLSGALYVLKGNAFLRISVGGRLDDAERLNKSEQLAREALQHLP